MARDDIGRVKDLSGAEIIALLREILNEIVLLRKQMTYHHSKEQKSHSSYADNAFETIMDAEAAMKKRLEVSL